MNNLLKLSLPFLFFLSCNSNGAGTTEGDPVITGKITNLSGKPVLFERLTASEVIPLDTLKPDESGNFTVQTRIPETSFYRLFVDQQNFIILLLDSASKVTVTGDATNLSASYTVKGSEESQKLKDLYDTMRRHDRFRDSLQAHLQQFVNEPGLDSMQASLSAQYQESENKRAAYLSEFATENSTSLVSLIALSSLPYDQHSAVYKKVYEELPPRYPNSPMVEPFVSSYRELTRTAQGEAAPDIVMATPDGGEFALSQLKGKWVLVDFWASWCKPCRMENPNVVKIYNKYKDQGFEILGVSLDRDKAAWVQAIKDDNLTWNQISDLLFWNSPVVKTYGISGIPFTVLVDPEGKIVAKGLRGPALEQKLEEIFGK